MTDIFISYKREDLEEARRIAQALSEEGFTVFFDVHDEVGIRAGETWDQRLEKELSDTKAVVVLWSHRSVVSNNVRDEARRAAARGILLPVMLDDCDAPLGLGNLQAADLRDWQGDRSDPHWRFLIDRGIRNIVEGGVAAEDVPPPSPVRHRSAASQPPRSKLIFGGLGAGLLAVLIAIALYIFLPSGSADCAVDDPACASADAARQEVVATSRTQVLVKTFTLSNDQDGDLVALRTLIERNLVELLWRNDLTVAHALVSDTGQSAALVFEGTIERVGDDVTAYLVLKDQGVIAGTAEVSAPLEEFQSAFRSLPPALLFFMGRNPENLAPLDMNQRPTDSLHAWWMFEEARRLATQDQTDEAAHFLDRARQVDPGFATALWAKGDLLAALGEEGGETLMREALSLNPDLQRYSIHTALVDPLPALKLAALSTPWEELRPGLQYREIDVAEYGLQLHAWTVDPERFDIAIEPARGTSGETVDQIRKRSGGILAVNGGYWDEDSAGRVTPSGLFITSGVQLKSFTEGVGSGVLLVTEDAVHIQYGKAALPDDVRGGVQAGPIVIEPGGEIGIRSNKPVRAERTAACVTSKGELMLMTVQGGISLYEMATLLGAPDHAFGFDCTVALNLGGGPTAQASFEDEDRSIQIPGLWITQSAIVVSNK